MRFFVSGPRVAGLRFGAILGRRDLSALFPWPLWRVPVCLALGAGGVLVAIFVADFVSSLPN